LALAEGLFILIKRIQERFIVYIKWSGKISQSLLDNLALRMNKLLQEISAIPQILCYL